LHPPRRASAAAGSGFAIGHLRPSRPTPLTGTPTGGQFGNPLDELNCGARAASFPFVGKREPCRIRAESIEGLFVWEIQQVRLGLAVERTNAQLQTPRCFGSSAS